jgi:hypothetical protein
MKKEATLKSAKGLVQKTFDEKRGNPNKRKVAHLKDLWWKKRQPKNARGSFKRPPMKKEATQKNAKGLIQKTSNENRGNPEKHKGARSKDTRWKRDNPKKCKGTHSKDLRQKRDNHSRSLVPHRKLANQHNNLKGVSSQSRWIWVPMLNAAKEGAITQGRMGHCHSFFFEKKQPT